MTKELKINKDTITSIASYVDKKDTFFTWKGASFFLGINIREPGFYTDFGDRVDPSEVEKRYSDVFVRDCAVYYFPHIVMRTSSGNSHTMYFDTEDELKRFKDEHFSDSRWIDKYATY